MIEDLVLRIQKNTDEGRVDRILDELRSHHPETLDRVALDDVAAIAIATEVVTFLDVRAFLEEVLRGG